MTKHTPGPWTATNASPLRQYPGISGADGYLIAQLGSDVLRKTLSYRGDDEGQSNARLISAAPDLLEALKKAEAALAIASSYVNMEQRYMRSSLESIRDAIAKAKS